MSSRRDKSLDALWRKHELALWVLRREFGIADKDSKGWQKFAVLLVAEHQLKKLLLSPRDELAHLLATPWPLSRPRGRPRTARSTQAPKAPGQPRKYFPQQSQRTLAEVDSVKTKLQRRGKRATDMEAVLWIIRDIAKEEGMSVSARKAHEIAKQYSRTTLPHLRRIIKRSKLVDSLK